MRSKQSRADAVLHPQRLAIIRALATSECTARELAERLPEVPQASLYRHIALLLEHDVIRVTAERQVRGSVERTYGIGAGSIVTAEDLATATPDDHFRYFTTFAAGLLGQFGAYVDRGDIDPLRDGVGYREHVLHLTHDELVELLGEIRGAISARQSHEPGGDRTPRLIATVTLPTTDPKA